MTRHNGAKLTARKKMRLSNGTARRGQRSSSWPGSARRRFARCCSSDMGAEVIRVDRAANVGHDDSRVGGPPGEESRFNLLARGRRNIAVDLKNPAGVAATLRLIDRADALIEGFRPGVMERLGLGPDICLARNQQARLRADDRLGPGRADRPYRRARHQLHRACRACSIRSARPADRRCRRSNLVGDFGGGALYLAMGVLAGIISARATGKGQVVDCSMVEGSASLDDDDVCRARLGRLDREARPQPHRWRRALLPCLRDEGRRVRLGRLDRAAILCAAACSTPGSKARPAGADRPRDLARRCKSGSPRIFKAEDPRRMGRDHAGDRYLLRPGIASMSEAIEPPAQPPPRQLSSRSTASPSRRRRRAFSARRPRSSARRPGSASTPTRSCATGASRPPRSRRIAPK